METWKWGRNLVIDSLTELIQTAARTLAAVCFPVVSCFKVSVA